MNHRRLGWLTLCVALILGGCGADGGVGGTGISTITGNVSIGAAAETNTTSDLEGIGVGIRGTDIRTATDKRGAFELVGEFDGQVSLQFTERDGTIDDMPGVDVPSGGVVALLNVRFSRGRATPERIEVDFNATIVQDAVCDGGTPTVVVLDRNQRNTYGVLLDGASYSVDQLRCPEDTPAACTELLAGRTLRISGTQSGGAIQANRVRLENCRLPGRSGH